MPNTDLRFGFNKIAKHYYFPGWHQQASLGEFMVNVERWQEISERDRHIIQLACFRNIVRAMTRGEALQGPALDQFKREGVQIHYFDDATLRRLKALTDQVMAEEAAADADFAKIWASIVKFRGDFKEWAQLSRLPRGFGG